MASRNGNTSSGPATTSRAPASEIATGDAGQKPAHPPPPDLPPEEFARRTDLSKKMSGAFGEIVSVLMRSDAHRTQMLMDLEWLVLPALATGQFKIAGAQSKAIGYLIPVAVVLWARVSLEIDARLTATLESPIRLKPDEWVSGDIYWLVEAVGDSRVIGPTLQNLAAQEWKGKEVKFRSRGEKGEAVVRILELKDRTAQTAQREGA